MTVTRVDIPAADARLVLERCGWLQAAKVSRVWCHCGALMWVDCRCIARDVDPRGVTHRYAVSGYTLHDVCNVLTEHRRAVVAVEEVTR